DRGYPDVKEILVALDAEIAAEAGPQLPETITVGELMQARLGTQSPSAPPSADPFSANPMQTNDLGDVTFPGGPNQQGDWMAPARYNSRGDLVPPGSANEKGDWIPL